MVFTNRKSKNILIIAIFSLNFFSNAAWSQWQILKGLGDAYGEIARQEILKNQIIEAQRERDRLQYEMEAKRALEASIERQRQEAEEAKRLERASKIKAREERMAGVTGSGFFVSNTGHVITNAHVIKDYPDIYVKTASGKTLKADLISVEENIDLAILKVDTQSTGLKLRLKVDDVKGEEIFAVGYPIPKIQGQESKITNGVISSLSGIRDEKDWMQISAPIQGGNSGGPLVSKNGEVLGVVVAMANANRFEKISGNLPQNVNYAIKSNLVLRFMENNGLKNISSPISKKPLQHVDASTVLIIAKEEFSRPSQLSREEFADTKTKAIQAYQEARSLYNPSRNKGEENKSSNENKRAFDLLLKALEFDEYLPGANFLIGYFYNLGIGTSEDFFRAAKHYKIAAEGGISTAQGNLGILYRDGKGVPQDYKLARHWFTKAVNNGSDKDINNLASMHLLGLGGDKDVAEAVMLYEKSAKKGNTSAQAQLGLIYYSGIYVGPRYDLSYYWAEKSAAGDSPIGINLMGVLHEGGLGVAKDLDKALLLYRIASELGDANAKSNLARLSKFNSTPK